MAASPETKTPASPETLNPSSSSTDSPMTTHHESPPPNQESDTSLKRKRENNNINNDEKDPETKNGSVDPKSSEHPLHKTSLCSYYRRNAGNCSHGEACRFAHNEAELRPRPDGSWDPTSERVKKLKRRENEDESEGEDDDGNLNGIMMTEVLAEFGGDAQLSKCLVHLPMKWDSQELKGFLNEEGIIFKSARKKKGMSVGFITFEAEEQVKSLTEVLEGKTVGNKKLKVGDVVPRSYDDNIKSAQQRYQNVQSGAVDEANDNENGDEVNGSSSRAKSARDAVTPLAHMPYTEQLEQKKNSVMQTLKRLTRNARKACPKGITLPEWVAKSREIGGLPCKLEGIIESPIVNGYRNKCEFSVGYSVQGKPTVGFMLGNFREGVTAVEEPVNCPNVSKVSCRYAFVFQEFLQDSALPIWNRFNNTGFWRQLTVREGRNPQKSVEVEIEADISEVMVMVQVSTEGYDDGLINSELKKMTQAFVTGAASTCPPLPLTALLLQDHRGISNVAPADAPLRSLPITNAENETEPRAEEVKTINDARIHDYIGSLQFSISPTAFFQVNTLAAEKLYSLAGDWAGLGPDTLLFDVCCGTGTIGLTLANRVGMVVGIEMNASAVSDAQRNAEINGIANCRFICSKAENVMGPLLREYLDVPQQLDEDSNPSDNDKNQSETVDLEKSSVDDEPASKNCVKEENAQGSITHDKSNAQSNTVKDGSTIKHQFKNVVAIVDPPRSGLHPVVIKALRTHPRLRRLVYISCNPETLVANAIELCTPSAEKAEKGSRNHGWRKMGNAGLARQRLKSMPMSEPFQPIKAMAVDLFPHTPHCELVMLLER